MQQVFQSVSRTRDPAWNRSWTSWKRVRGCGLLAVLLCVLSLLLAHRYTDSDARSFESLRQAWLESLSVDW